MMVKFDLWVHDAGPVPVDCKIRDGVVSGKEDVTNGMMEERISELERNEWFNNSSIRAAVCYLDTRVKDRSVRRFTVKLR